jgi:hypothetical protein
MTRLALIIFGCAMITSCDTVEKGSGDVAKKDINAVMQAHTAEILAIPGVTGLAISELEDKTPCIWVLVVEESEELARKIPDSLEGHPVKIVVSGEIRPLEGQ